MAQNDKMPRLQILFAYSRKLSQDPKNVHIGSRLNTFDLGDQYVAVKVPGTWTDHLAFGLRKDSDLKALFDREILKMYESGVMEKLLRKWTSAGGESTVQEGEGPAPLGYENVSFPFFALVGVAGMAVLIAVAEKLAAVYGGKRISVGTFSA